MTPEQPAADRPESTSGPDPARDPIPLDGAAPERSTPEHPTSGDPESSNGGDLPPPLTVHHLGDDLVIVDKPSGVPVHRGQGGRDQLALLQWTRDTIDKFVYPVHRLDQPTSGIVAFATSSEGAKELQCALSASTAVKEYFVLCRGETEEQFVEDRSLSARRSGRKVQQEARTEFTRIAYLPETRASLLRARLHTGRYHQIRRHLAHVAHQVIGDTTHGKGDINRRLRDAYGLPRLFLHAHRLAFDWPPGTGRRLEIVSPIARDLVEFLRRLPDRSALPADLLDDDFFAEAPETTPQLDEGHA